MKTDHGRRRLVAISHACIRRINRAVYREMEKLGWEVIIVVPSEWDYLGKVQPPESSLTGDPLIHPLPLIGTHPRKYFFPNLEATLEHLSPDCVFVDADPVSRLAWQAGKWGKKQQVPVGCLSCENLPFDMISTWKRQGWRGIPSSLGKQNLVRKTRPLVAHVFTINDDGTRIFQSLGYRSVSKIPLGFDPRFFAVHPEWRSEIQKRLGLQEFVIAYFGRMVREKGVHLLLSSLSRLQDLKWHLLLDQFDSRKNEYLAELDSLIDRYGLRHRISFIEADHGEVAQYMNAADIVVLPSISTPRWKEQYGRVVPEAMACGCCVVTSNVGALPELVQDAGCVTPEGDEAELASCLRSLLNDRSLRESLRVKCLERSKELSIAAQANSMDEVLDRLVSQTSSGR